MRLGGLFLLTRALLVVAVAAGCSSGAATGSKDSGEEAGGHSDAAADERADANLDLGPASDVASDLPRIALLDACFADLPAPVGLQVLAHKSSGDATTQVLMALDTMGKTGLAYPWTLVRLGLVIEGAVICITEKSDLAYTVTHHNCSDVASASAGATRYELVRPGDTSTELRIFNGGTLVRSIALTTHSCIRSDGPGTCPLVGPC